MPKPLFMKDLDALGCSAPDCAEKHTHDEETLYLTCKQHTGAAVWTSYHKDEGTLWVQCAVCETLLAVIMVAHG